MQEGCRCPFGFKITLSRTETRKILCKSANVFGDLAETFNHDFGASYFGNDAFILMNQYMDVQIVMMTAVMMKVNIREMMTSRMNQMVTRGRDAGKLLWMIC
jgi:hypothetical protein